MQNIDLPSFDLNLLTALEVLLEECNVTQAAERLNISQPSMSRTYSRLRDALDDPLLIRTPNGYIKTPRAEWLQTQLKEPLISIRNTLAAPTYDPATESGVFKIGTLDYGEMVLIPILWQILDKACANARLDIVSRTIYSAQEIVDNKADVSIGVKPHSSFKNCTFEPLFEDRNVCVMSNDHPLADIDLTLEAYLAYGHSIFSTYTKQLSMIDSSLQSRGLKRRVVKRSPNFLAAHHLLGQTKLLLTTTARAVASIQKSQNLIVKELPFELEPVVLCQIWHVKNTNNLRHKWLREQITKAAAELTPVEKFD